MIETAKTHKKLAATVLGGAFLIGGGVSYGVAHNANQIDAVKQARKDAILLTCEQGNERHDDTIFKLKLLTKQTLRKHPEQRKQVEQSFAPTVLLVNALAPKYDCQKRVDRLGD